MHHEILLTEDGSHTIGLPAWNLTYHSRHGAIHESQHIYIESGLNAILPDRPAVSVFEMGFGTGLNALLTLNAVRDLPVSIYYEAVENDPLELVTAASLNYTDILGTPDLKTTFLRIHEAPWNTVYPVAKNFQLYKRSEGITDVTLSAAYDIVYYDAFDPAAQPGLWTADIFRKLHEHMTDGAVLVTYSSKTAVRRALLDAGFQVEKLPGPRGKREIVKAVKPAQAKT